MAWLTSPIFNRAMRSRSRRIDSGGRKSSRLYKKLVYESRSRWTSRSISSPLILGSVFEVQATARPGVEARRPEKAINAELRECAKVAVECGAGRRAKRHRSDIAGLETTGGFGAWRTA